MRRMLKRTLYSLALAVALTTLAAAPSHAVKDLGGRFGLGYTNEGGVSAMSAKYGISPELTFQGALGYKQTKVKDGPTNSGYNLGGKVFYNFVREENMLFYIGGGLGIMNKKETTPHDNGGEVTTKTNGFVVAGTVGVEYFIPWFPNLGMQLEYSVGLQSGKSGDVKSTTIGLPFDAAEQSVASTGSFGFHYYFGGAGTVSASKSSPAVESPADEPAEEKAAEPAPEPKPAKKKGKK